ncbi:MAG TPA: hypothetical protein VNT75_26330 [Symbiobacteriaceae bacterium]|nr:hypothetical protein [Symbiobacteriaceae bacterium]
MTKELATLQYLSPTTWASGALTLQAQIDDAADGSAGNLQNAGGQVTFVFQKPDGSAAGSVVGTIGAGATTAIATATTNTLPAGAYKVTVQLNNNSYYTALDATGYMQANMDLVVAPAGPVQYSDTVTLSATLSVTGGSPVGANEPVLFTVKTAGGVTLDTSPTVLTNASGVATWTYKADRPAATYKVEASYAGGTYYKQVTSAQTDLVVNREDASITTAASVNWAASLNLTATITDASDGSAGNVGLIGNNVQFIITKPDNTPVQTVTASVSGSGTTGTATATVTLPNGGYKVRVHIDTANGYYEATDALSNIKAGTTLAVTAPAQVDYSDVANIVATLSEAGGSTVGVGESVTITVTNGSGTQVASYTGTTNASGQVSWAWKVDQPAGNYTVAATYAGTAYYGSSSGTAAGPLQVTQEDATLTYLSPTTWTGSSVTLTARIDDASDGSAGDVSAVGSGVKFEVRRPNGTLVNTYTGTVTGSGTTSMVTAAATLPADAYQVTVLIDSANGYYTATPVVGYIKADTTITVAAAGSVPYSDNVSLSATLSVTGGSPVGAGEQLVFTVLNASNAVVATSPAVPTNGSGVATWTYKADTAAGNYTVKASYAGGGSYYNAQATSNAAPLTVTKETATLSYVGPLTWTTTNVTLTAQIDDEADGMPGNVQNVGSAVTFEVTRPDGSLVGTYTGTLAAGTTSAQVTASATLPRGAYKVTVKLGSNNYYSTLADGVGYIKANMALTVSPITGVPYSDTTSISATLAVAGGGPTVGAGEQVVFTVKDGAATVITSPAMPTNASGVATWSYTNSLMAKTYTVEASYVATTYYNSVTSAPENLVIGLESANITPQADVNWAASLNLTATITEVADATPGQVSNIGNNAQFVITKPDNTPQITLTGSVTGVGASGTATVTAALPNGAYKVTVQINSANGYYQGTATPSFYIKAGTTLTATAPATVQYSDVANLSTKLTVAGTATGIANEPVTLTISRGGTTVDTLNTTTDGSGNVAWAWKADQPAGAYTLTVNYAGNSYYGNSSASQNFTVLTESATLAYLGPTSYAGSPVTLQARITDAADGSAGDVSKVGNHIRFTVKRPDGTTVGTYNASVPASGTTAVVTASVPLTANGYEVTVDIDPADLYYAATAVTGYIQASSTLSAPSLSPGTIEYSDSTTVTSTLQVSGGGTISGAAVVFTVLDSAGNPTGVTSPTVTTNGSGVATWTYTDTTLPAGSYKVRATYAGSTFYTSATSTDTNLTINKETATVAYTGPTAWASSLTLTATVSDAADGSPGDVQKLTGGGVLFVVDNSDGSNYGTFPATTLTGGPASAIASVNVTLPKSGYKVTVVVDSNNGYYTSPTPAVDYIKLNTSMTLTPASATINYSDVVNLTATVNLVGGGNVGANQTVTFTVTNNATSAVVTTQNVLTNGSGVASWQYQHLLAGQGNYTITASFPASGYYNSAPSQTTALTVTRENATIATNVVSFTGTGSPQTLNLTATLTQEADGYSGDLTKALVVWTFTPAVTSPSVSAVTFQAYADSFGVATVSASVPNWPFTVTAQVDPANQYWVTATPSTRSIKANPVLALAPITVQYSDKPTLAATLTSGGIPVVGRTVGLAFDSTGPGGASNYATVSGVPATDSSGVASQWYDMQIIWPAQSWTSAGRATFAGDTYFNAATTVYADATIAQENATITAAAPNGNSGNITITFTEVTDTPNPGATGNPAGATVRLNVMAKKNNRTDWYTCNANAGPYTPSGNPASFTVSVYCDPPGAGQWDLWIEMIANNYYTSNGYQVIGGIVTIQATSPVVAYGGTTTLSASVGGTLANKASNSLTAFASPLKLASLTADAASPMRSLSGSLIAAKDITGPGNKNKPSVPPGLVGQPIEFFVNGISVGTAPIGEDGTANLPYKPDLPAGQYTVEAKFHGGAKYGPASGTGTLTVLATPLVLSYTGDTASTPESLTLKAGLGGAQGDVDLTRATVQFTLTTASGEPVGTYQAPAQADGTAVYQLTNLPAPGTYHVTVALADEQYFKAASVTAEVTVPAPPPPAEGQTPTAPPATEPETPAAPPATEPETPAAPPATEPETPAAPAPSGSNGYRRPIA